MSVEYERINNTMGKMALYLGNHDHPCVSVSGGSDSDIIVHIIATYFREFLPKTHFVFVNTGLEYDATKRHLDYLDERYDIKIDRIRGMSVVTAVHRYGVPVLSKAFSECVDGAQNGKRWAINRINRTKEYSSIFALTDPQKKLADYLLQSNVKVSDMCCKKAKKEPIFSYFKENKCDLNVTGERIAEGGVRSAAHKSCFEPAKTHKWDKYMPLWYWNDETKAYYKQAEGIIYSDCYEVWGMKRTGCVGCPFNSRVGEALKMLRKYEPKRYKACMNLFGESYRLMDKFGVHRKPIFDEQMHFDEMMEEAET